MTSQTLARSDADHEPRIEHYEHKWRGIEMRVMYAPNAYGGAGTFYHFSRIEVETDRRTPLPITDTGYKSQCLPGGAIEAAGGPIAYIERWLEEASRSIAWKIAESDTRQGRLF